MWLTDGPNSSFLVYNCFLYVGIEPRDLDMLGKHSITEGFHSPIFISFGDNVSLSCPTGLEVTLYFRQ